MRSTARRNRNAAAKGENNNMRISIQDGMSLVAADKLATEVCTGLRVNERAIEVDPQLRQFVINDSLWPGVKHAAIKALAKDAKGHGSEKRTHTVTAQAHDRVSGKPVGPSRDEDIDVKSNPLFKGAKTAADVKKKYESFWNDLNPKSSEVVKVTNVKDHTAALNASPVRPMALTDSIHAGHLSNAAKDIPSHQAAMQAHYDAAGRYTSGPMKQFHSASVEFHRGEIRRLSEQS